MSATAHHLRTRQLLSNVDAASVQTDRNSSLRNMLLDSEDVLLQLHSQLFSVKLRASISAVRDEAAHCRSTFERELSYTHTTLKHPPSRYAAECSLRLPLSSLQTSDGAEGNCAALESLSKVAGVGCVDERPFWERFHLLMHRSEELTNVARLNTAPWVQLATDVVQVLDEVSRRRPVTEGLDRLDEQIQFLTAKVAELEKEEEAAYDAGETSLNEDILCQQITIMEAVNDLITQKFHLLERERSEVFDCHLANISAIEGNIKKFVGDFRTKASSEREEIEADLNALESKASRTRSDNASALASFQASRDASDAFLAVNAEQQDAVWEQMRLLELELVRLATARREEIDRRVKLVEREERREMDVSGFESFASDHSETLTAAARLCEAKELLAEMLEELTLGVCDLSRNTMLSGNGSLGEMQAAAHEEHYRHFRRHYLLLGKLQYKKERVLDEWVQRAQVAHSLQELAMDSFNPKARQYALEAQETEDMIAAVTSELDVLRRKADLYVEAFKPTERVLREQTNKPFEHPVQELLRINRERGKKIARFHALSIAGFDSKNATGVDTTWALSLAEKEKLERDLEAFRQSKYHHESAASNAAASPKRPQITTPPSTVVGSAQDID